MSANPATKSTPESSTTPIAAPVAKFQTGAEALIRCLEREGVEYVFGLSGGAAMPIFDALVDSKIKLILVRHEQGATHMADGYARATGKPGVVLVTSGPGATNTVTGMLTALMDSVPMIVLTGQTISPMLGKDAFQEADVTGITYPVVKHSYLVKNPNDIPRITREAFYLAGTGRPGPVLIDLPKDITSAPCTAPFDRQGGPGRLLGAGTSRQGCAAQGGGVDRPQPQAGALRRPRRGDRRRRPGHHAAGREAQGADRQHAAGQGRLPRGPSRCTRGCWACTARPTPTRRS